MDELERRRRLYGVRLFLTFPTLLLRRPVTRAFVLTVCAMAASAALHIRAERDVYGPWLLWLGQKLVETCVVLLTKWQEWEHAMKVPL